MAEMEAPGRANNFSKKHLFFISFLQIITSKKPTEPNWFRLAD
jgi:hypothetical protein